MTKLVAHPHEHLHSDVSINNVVSVHATKKAKPNAKSSIRATVSAKTTVNQNKKVIQATSLGPQITEINSGDIDGGIF